MPTREKPTSHDLHEQRQEDQPGEGMLRDGSPPAPKTPATKVHPWRQKASRRGAPPVPRDRANRPD